MPDKELTQGFIRSRFRDLEPFNTTDSDNKAFAQYFSAAPVTPLGHFEQTVTTSPVGLPSIPAEARRVVLQGVTAGFTYTDDGTNPSATHGMPIPADTVFVYDTVPDANFKMWSASSVVVRVAYYG